MLCAAACGQKGEALPQHTTELAPGVHGVLVASDVAMLQSGKIALERREDLLQRAEPRICAFDIETTKLPLQFPNSEHDQVRVVLKFLGRQVLHQLRLVLLGSSAHGDFT